MPLFHPSDAAPECASLTDPSIANLTFSFVILIGILVSYLPQHHRIISRGTSEGISPLFLLLGATSGTCGFLNILILSWGVLGCCTKGIGGFNCLAASLGVGQVGLQWTCFVVVLLLFLIYFPRTTGLEAPGTVPEGTPSLRTATLVTIISVVHFVVFAAISFYLSLLTSEPTPHEPTSPAPPSRTLVAYANFLGVQSMVLASLQYVPQIMTTWRLKHVGSLSIPMMLIQTPGSFIWAISLATREGTKWSSWLTYVVTGVLQGGLLVMCISWELRERAERKKILDAIDADVAIRTGANGAADAERRPLLADER